MSAAPPLPKVGVQWNRVIIDDCGSSDEEDADTTQPSPATATAALPAAAERAAAAPAAPPVPHPLGAAQGGKKTPCCIVVGMAGSGKTTLMQRLNAHAHARKRPAYMVNLDPAVMHVPYGASIDIRDTVKYKELMAQYKLGHVWRARAACSCVQPVCPF